MLSMEDFATLKIGDLIEADPMFSGLSDEPVVLRVATDGADRKDFVVTYLGVTLGRWSAKRNGEKLSWTFK